MRNDLLTDKIAECFHDRLTVLEAGVPDMLNERRREAAERFAAAGVPGDKEEAYRDFRLYSRLKEQLEQKRIVTDAVQAPHFTEYPSGAVRASLGEFARQLPGPYARYSAVDGTADPMADLCMAFARRGTAVYLPEGSRSDEPLEMTTETVAPDGIELGYYDLIVAEAGAEGTIVIRRRAGSRNRVCDVVLGENAKLEVVEYFEEGAPGNLTVNSMRVTQAAGSVFRHVLMEKTNAGAVRNNLSVFLTGRGAEAHLFGAIVPQGDGWVDNATRIEHLIPDCHSNEHYKCVVHDRGTSRFNGYIYVAPDAQKTEAYQQNNNIVLGEAGRAMTQPQLEIYADDVRCSHGATVGQLDAEAVYYMRQRGIPEKEAKALMLNGFIGEILENVSDEKLREEMARIME